MRWYSYTCGAASCLLLSNPERLFYDVAPRNNLKGIIMVRKDKKQIALIVNFEEYALIRQSADKEGRSMGSWVKSRVLPYLDDVGDIQAEPEA